MNQEIQKLEKELNENYMLLKIQREIAFNVGAGRRINRKGYAHRDPVAVRSLAWVECQRLQKEIDGIFAKLIEAEKAGA